MSVLLRSMTDINDRIIEVVASGEPESIEREPDEVVAECARRYIQAQMHLRERAAARSREAGSKFSAATKRAKATLRDKASRVTTELARSLHREWNEALLAGEFALPDGSRVTWAAATVEQHRVRADQLEAISVGNMATASIHRRAISDLQAAGAGCLAELS